ncbi:hypothetical protein EGM88_00850 [Aureibaculum marinum]|uniref:ATP-grasp fold RimK-type domain-containing protein n=1 Tax=Aureibaculum marinum TaxID=2487930 RepID=A0A3N4PB24_9FLAO|nr:hypothetical protein [Aureibaculum marinum]RPE00930.1 hypothetical protein EGM88_00850 [Aureibaculum marinum]
MEIKKIINVKIFLTKLFHSEHWPTYLFYIPLIPYFLYKAILAKSLTFFLIVNPAIKYSGMGSESKFKTLKLLPEQYIPKSILITPKTDFNSVLISLNNSKIEFPLIAKPDVGFRGILVQKINTISDLKNYLKNNDIAIILQEYVSFQNECGLFYHKIPGKNKGKITSVTLKKFVTVIGNGMDDLETLILKDKRAFLYHTLFKKIHLKNYNTIPKKNEIVKLTVIGNHSKGTQFINGNHLIDQQLEAFLDKITANLPDFNYGRFDIKYKTFNKLKNAEDFKILELNGIIAEPTHIYDTEKSNYFASLKTILNHWSIANKIARYNHSVFKKTYPSLLPFLKDMLLLKKYSFNLKKKTSK